MQKRILSILLFCVVLSGCERETPAPDVADRHALAGRAPSSETFRAAVNAVLPGVAYIEVEARPQMDGLFTLLHGTEVEPPVSFGAGSGVIFRDDGYILTADHVVQGAERVLVSLPDRRRFEARVIARDPSTDIAVVKIEGENLPAARLGDSRNLELGDWVLALGSPLGLQFTVTAGIVSAKGRAIGILEGASQADARASPIENFIQTDAAVNPGNSGGPLVNLAGEVVGINTAILDPSQRGTYAGYSFAVPINLARQVAEDLIEFGEVRRPFLGVYLDDLSPADVAVYEVGSAEGVEIVHVQKDSPADRAGLQLGDVIRSVDGHAVRSRSELQAVLATLEPGKPATFGVTRYGESREVTVQLGLLRTGIRADPPPEERGPTRVGFAVAQGRAGVVVAAVQSYSPARQAGIRPGQLITSVNRTPVRSVEEFANAVRRTGRVVSFVVVDPQVGQLIVNYELRP